jgi:Sec-independent protein translocase protein TatA
MVKLGLTRILIILSFGIVLLGPKRFGSPARNITEAARRLTTVRG